MAHAYTPGLKVTPNTTLRYQRVLPLAGEVLVREGQAVQARDVIARALMPGDVLPVNVANRMSISPGDLPSAMLKKPGDAVSKGEPIARTKGLFGLFKTEYLSEAKGTLESVSHVTGQVIIRGEPIPVEVLAYLTGNVVQIVPEHGAVVEAEAALAQGIFGVGGEAFGTIRMVGKTNDQTLTPELLTSDMRGQIVVVGGRATAEAVKHGIELGIAAIVAGGIDDQDLKSLLGYDLGVAITGSEKLGLTLIITEGFGDIAMAERTFGLLRAHEGQEAACNGTTQIRAGVIRPEIVIPRSLAEASSEAAAAWPSRMSQGTPVRIIRDPYFGILGEVAGLPPEPRVLESGSKARIVEVRLRDGKTVSVPRANVELIER